MTLFIDRRDAGRQLAERLSHYKSDALILGLPRGGVAVAFEVAAALGAPLDVFIVRSANAERAFFAAKAAPGSIDKTCSLDARARSRSYFPAGLPPWLFARIDSPRSETCGNADSPYPCHRSRQL